MKLSRSGKLKHARVSVNLNLGDGCSVINQLQLQNLPSMVLQTKQEQVRFCFLLLLLTDESVRKCINKSRITVQFWTKFRELHGFQQTFMHFSDKEMLNVFKYIYFYPAFKQFPSYLVVKSYFYLDSIESFPSEANLAGQGKKILKFLKNLTRKNSRTFSLIFKDFNFMNYYNNGCLTSDAIYSSKLQSSEPTKIFENFEIIFLSIASKPQNQIYTLIGVCPVPNINQLIDLRINFSFNFDPQAQEASNSASNELSSHFDNIASQFGGDSIPDFREETRIFLFQFKEGKHKALIISEYSRASRATLIHSNNKWSKDQDNLILQSLRNTAIKDHSNISICLNEKGNDIVNNSSSTSEHSVNIKLNLFKDKSNESFFQRCDYLTKQHLPYSLS